jgi:hypothetical protein
MTHETITAELERRGWIAQDHRMTRNSGRGISIRATRDGKTLSVQAGDYLANGQILVASIDMSNPQNPRVVLAESWQQVILGVGKSPDSLTAVPLTY